MKYLFIPFQCMYHCTISTSYGQWKGALDSVTYVLWLESWGTVYWVSILKSSIPDVQYQPRVSKLHYREKWEVLLLLEYFQTTYTYTDVAYWMWMLYPNRTHLGVHRAGWCLYRTGVGRYTVKMYRAMRVVKNAVRLPEKGNKRSASSNIKGNKKV